MVLIGEPFFVLERANDACDGKTILIFKTDELSGRRS